MIIQRWIKRALPLLAALLAYLPGAALSDVAPAWSTPYWGVAGSWGGTASHNYFAPVPWPNEPAPASCGYSCGDWKPYTRFGATINDPRVQDPSNGGTAPQNYVNISSSCTDKKLPSIYYSLYKGAAADGSQDVIMFRWRVEQIANNYATGPNPGSYAATSPWSSALWTVLFDLGGRGYRDFAAHLNGSSGGPSTPVDILAGIWGKLPTQSVDYTSDPNIHLLAFNPTAFVDNASKAILNFQNNNTPVTSWPNGAAETTWDYGSTRSRVVSTSPCNEYFVDYQIPVAMLDASADGGPKITRSTPLSMLFCTANSLNNPFQKDCALNRSFLGDSTKPGPFGDYVSFNRDAPYRQPIISSVTASGPPSCGGGIYTLTTTVQHALYLDNSGSVQPSIKKVEFYYYYDADGNGIADDGGNWVKAATGSLASGSLNTWSATWDASQLPKGQYLIGVQAVDDPTLHDDGVADAPVANRTFSYLLGSVAAATQAQIYNNGWTLDSSAAPALGWSQTGTPGWLAGAQAEFNSQPPSPAMAAGATEDWYGNPDATGTKVATAGIGNTVNSCGLAPTITKTVSNANPVAGTTTDFTLTITNNLTTALTLTRIDDVLPSGFTYNSAQGGTLAPSAAPNPGDNSLQWTFAATTLSAGASGTLVFRANVSATAGNYSNIASAATGFGTISSAPVALAVDSARISLSKTPSAYQVSPGDTLTYTLNYSNDSSVPVSAATITDTLPAGTTYSSCSGGSSCGISGGVVTWNIGSLAGAASGSVTLTLTVGSGYSSTSLANSAALDVVAPDGSHVNKTASSTIAVNIPAPAFSLTKTSSATQIAENANVTWTIAYNNYGTGSASSVVISDPLPSGFTYVSSSPSATSAPAAGANGTVTWNLGTIAANGSGSVQVVAKSTTPFSGSANPATNTASISWTGGTPVSAASDVGVTQSSTTCRSYYLENSTANVGTLVGNIVGTSTALSGNQYTSTSVAPSGGSATIQKYIGASGSPVETEVARFYQDPVSSQLVSFDGSSTLAGQVYYTKSNALGGSANSNLTMYVHVYDYDPANGNETSIGSVSYTDNGSPTPPVSLSSVTPSGSLAKGHRLLIVVTVLMANNKATTMNLQVASAQSFVQICSPAPANLVLQKSASAATINATGSGRTLTYTINYTNTSGATAATSAVLSDALPAGTTFASQTSSPAATSTTLPAVGANGTVTWNFASIAAGGSGSASVTVNVPDDLTGTAAINNTASLSSTQTAAVTATATTSVIGSVAGSPSLTIAKSASKTFALANDTVTYRLVVVNVGTASASSVVVTDDFPDQAYFSYGSCTTASGTCSQAGGVLTWNVGTLAAGASATLTFTMNVAAAGVPAGVTQLANTATVSDAGYCTGGTPPASCTSNSVTVTISGTPNLTLSKGAAPSSNLKPGDTITYTLTVGNTGSASASSVVVTDPIPSGVSYAGGTISASAGSGTFDAVNNRVVYNIASLGAGSSATLSFPVVVDTPGAGTTSISISNVATVSAANAASRSASAGATGSATPAMILSKSAPAQLAYPATTLSRTANAATTVAVADASQLAIGQTVNIAGTYAQITGISATTLTLNTAVTASSGSPVIASFTYTLSYQNTGAGIAPSVVLTDTLPAGLNYVSSYPTASVHPAAGANGALSWSIGDVAPAAGGTVSVTVMPTAAGSFSNSAHITCTGCTPPADPSAATVVGGLVVTKRTTTPVANAGSTATYEITVQNTLGSAVSGFSVTDALASGFSYASTTSITINGASATASSAPSVSDTALSWSGFSAAIPAGGTLVLTFVANIDANAGALTYQNFAGGSAPGGVGLTAYDALSSTADDVTVLAAGSGLLKGRVYRRNDSNAVYDSGIDTPLANVKVTIGDCGSTCYVVYTDSSGYFARVVAPGTWSVTADSASGDLSGSGLALVLGSSPASVSVPNQGQASNDFAYAIAAPDMAVDVSALPATGTVGVAYSGSYTCTNAGTLAANAGGTTCTISGLPTGVTAGSCTITGGGTWSAGNTVAAGNVVTCQVSGTPSAAGTFSAQGSTGATGDGNAANNSATQSIVIAAPTTYTVTYNGNGNTGGSAPSDGNSPYVSGATVTVLGAGTLAKAANTFVNWNTRADGSGTSYAAGATFVISGNTTLYAQWTPVTYTVTYNGNGNTGGSAPVDGNSPYATGATVTVLGAGTLAKAANTFATWNTRADGSGTSYAPGATFAISGNTTLYAQWAPIAYTVTYFGNGNTGGSAPVDARSPYQAGATVTVLGAGTLVKAANTFVGWNSRPDGTGVSYAPAASFAISGNMALYAQWAPIAYTVTYDGNGNTGGSAPSDSHSPYAAGASVTVLGAATLAKAGFTFVNWNTKADGSGISYAPAATFTIAANTALYAQWTALATYTVTYDGNGNTGGSAPVDGNSPYVSGATVTVLGAGTLAKAANTFAAWNTRADGSGTSYAAGATFVISSNTTLYAQWTPAPATGAIAGYVWYDLNHNHQRDGNEPGRKGWTVQLFLNGVLLAATTTDADGYYSFAGLAPGSGYEVRFINASGLTSGPLPVNGDGTGGGTPGYSRLYNITVNPAAQLLNQSLPIDPSGVVYNSVTRQPLAGAVVTLSGPAGFSASDVAGGSLSQTTPASGAYQFFLLPSAPSGLYQLSVSLAGYGFASQVVPPAASSWPLAGGAITAVSGAPQPGQPTLYYLTGPKPTADLTNNNIPLDPPAPAPLPPQVIPTLGEWGLLALAALLAISAAASLRRRPRR